MQIKGKYLKDELNNGNEEHKYNMQKILRSFYLYYDIKMKDNECIGVIDENKNEVTTEQFVEDIKKKIKEIGPISIDAYSAEILSQYTELEKLDIYIEIFNKLGQNEKDFLLQHADIKKNISINGITLGEKLDYQWIKKLSNYSFRDFKGDPFDINIDELSKRQDIYLQYINRIQ